MNNVVEFNKLRQRESLNRWLAECRRRMGQRFPKIDFDAECWPVQSLYQTAQANWNFTPSTNHFSGRDPSFCDVVRCLVAEMVITGKPKVLLDSIKSFRRLAATSVASIFDLTVSDLRALEQESLEYCEKHPGAADRH
jgi:hypothetical protein